MVLTIRSFSLGALLFGALVLPACHSARPVTNAPPASPTGIYALTVRINSAAAGAETMEGVLTVMTDTMTLDLRGVPCTVDPHAPVVPTQTRFKCSSVTSLVEGLILTLDRRNLEAQSGWSGVVIGQRTKNECIEYATNTSGQRVCVRWQTIAMETKTPSSGKILLRRTVSP